MRICVAHETVYRYERPAKSVIQTLRLTPRSHDGQHVVRWRIDVDQDVRLSQSEDAFGNISHAFTAIGSIESLRVRVEGEVETHDNAGVLHGVIERFPVALYLRDTDLTQADAPIRDFAHRSAGTAGGGLAACHALMQAIHDRIEVSGDPKQPAVGLTQAFAAGSGVAQDASYDNFIPTAATTQVARRVDWDLSGTVREDVTQTGLADSMDAVARMPRVGGHRLLAPRSATGTTLLFIPSDDVCDRADASSHSWAEGRVFTIRVSPEPQHDLLGSGT